VGVDGNHDPLQDGSAEWHLDEAASLKTLRDGGGNEIGERFGDVTWNKYIRKQSLCLRPRERDTLESHTAF